jgi:phytoene desaturase
MQIVGRRHTGDPQAERKAPNMVDKHVAVVGAGPGGLTASMILAHRGFRVTVFEKEDQVGGRNSSIQLGPYVFDAGPTFLMMKFVLDEMFREAGRNSEDYLEFVRLEPMYDLVFDHGTLTCTTDRGQMKTQIERLFPGRGDGLDEFMEKEANRFKYLFPCLQKNYSHWKELLAPVLLKALPHLSLGSSVIDKTTGYFGDERLAIAFSFQSKYLGMSPWECPAAFTMLAYLEHAYGIYHTQGGLSEISEAMAEVLREQDVELHLETPVRRIITEDGAARGVELESGERVEADEVVINADFAWSMENLVDPGTLKKWSPRKLKKKRFSCSTFMLYLGLDTLYEDVEHHNIVFAEDYRRNLEEIFETKELPMEPSFYVRNASVTDPNLAPEGHSAVYVLVPVPNLRGELDWPALQDDYRDVVMDAMESKVPMPGLREHIVEEKVITPDQWRDDYNVYIGATFNLAHLVRQMMYFRPRNRFEELDNCYLVGGGTHPGSGLPTIYESGRITANLLCSKYDVPYPDPSPLETKPTT